MTDKIFYEIEAEWNLGHEGILFESQEKALAWAKEAVEELLPEYTYDEVIADNLVRVVEYVVED